MIELKPCPFCGGKASLFVDDDVRVVCNKCSASSIPLTDARNLGGDVITSSVETVIARWNRRVEHE